MSDGKYIKRYVVKHVGKAMKRR